MKHRRGGEVSQKGRRTVFPKGSPPLPLSVRISQLSVSRGPAAVASIASRRATSASAPFPCPECGSRHFVWPSSGRRRELQPPLQSGGIERGGFPPIDEPFSQATTLSFDEGGDSLRRPPTSVGGPPREGRSPGTMSATANGFLRSASPVPRGIACHNGDIATDGVSLSIWRHRRCCRSADR